MDNDNLDPLTQALDNMDWMIAQLDRMFCPVCAKELCIVREDYMGDKKAVCPQHGLVPIHTVDPADEEPECTCTPIYVCPKCRAAEVGSREWYESVEPIETKEK